MSWARYWVKYLMYHYKTVLYLRYGKSQVKYLYIGKNISSVNDLRPVARTSCVMKVFERWVLCYLDKKVFDYIHPYQFAYKFKSRVEGVITYVLYNIYTHLHFPGASDRRLMSFFFNFSGAFNTVQPHLLYDKLLNMKLCSSLITWIINYHILRPQYVRFYIIIYDYH